MLPTLLRTPTCSWESIKDMRGWLDKQKEMKMETATKRISILRNMMIACSKRPGMYKGTSFHFEDAKERTSISDMRRGILKLLRRGKSIGTISTANPSVFISVGVLIVFLNSFVFLLVYVRVLYLLLKNIRK